MERSDLRALHCSCFGVGAAQAEPLKIRGAWVAPLANWASIWLQKKDLAVHFGQSYVFEPVRYAGTPPMITAIANNELEIGNLAFSTLADRRSAMPEWTTSGSSPTTSRTASPAMTPTNSRCSPTARSRRSKTSRARCVATNAAGSGVDVAMRAMLRKHGLEANRDYTIVEAPFPAMKAMLAEKKVDLIPAVLPFSLDPELKKIARAAVRHARRDRRFAVRHVVGAQAVHRRAPRRAGRFPGRFAADRALVSRPEEPRRGRRNRLAAHQATARALRLALHQDRLLSRSRIWCRISTRCRRMST